MKKKTEEGAAPVERTVEREVRQYIVQAKHEETNGVWVDTDMVAPTYADAIKLLKAQANEGNIERGVFRVARVGPTIHLEIQTQIKAVLA